MPRKLNTLCCGDNLAMLQKHIADESVDLVYLDPPFNSKRDFNLIFRDKGGKRATSQELIFADTWEWNETAEQTCRDLIDAGGKLAEIIKAFQSFLGTSDMMAYLAMMSPRLAELRRVLKPTGAIYLHCDPTASHYLKILMDAIFGPQFHRSEIVWKRSSAHCDVKQGLKNYGHIHDILLYYVRGEDSTWNTQFTPYDESYTGRDYRLIDHETKRRFRRGDLTAARPGGDTTYEWRVKRHRGIRERWVADLNDEYVTPKEEWEYTGIQPYKRRYWAYSKENMKTFAREGRLRHTFDGMPEYKRYLDEMPGVPLQDLWTDLSPIIAGAEERLPYPTQKPEALLERIIKVSSNEGDVVLDPFCGCGTTVQVAQRLGRRWIGIDVTPLSLAIIKQRLVSEFDADVFKAIQILEEPVDESGALALAARDKFGFQCWAVGRLGAPPIEQKKGSDRGIDGRIYFHDDLGSPKEIIISVKAGEHIGPQFVRELRGVIEREKAEMGILFCIKEPTAEMRREAIRSGVYKSLGGTFPRLQIVTAKDIFADKPLNIPGRINPYERKDITSERKPPTSAYVRPAAYQLRLLP
jgi:DNA modification methylase